MSPFAETEIAALRSLAAAHPGARLVLIGARALAHWIPMDSRTTLDIDVSVGLAAGDSSEPGLRLPGWNAIPHREHSWRTESGLTIDVLPLTDVELATGRKRWPVSGREMSVRGFRVALDDAVNVPLAADFSIGIATVPALTILKSVAYADQPHERRRDLADMAYVLDRYPVDGDLRRFEADVRERYVYETAGAFILGRELVSVAGEEDLEPIERLIRDVRTESDGGRARHIMLSEGPPGWDGNPRELLSRVEALAEGLGLGPD